MLVLGLRGVPGTQGCRGWGNTAFMGSWVQNGWVPGWVPVPGWLPAFWGALAAQYLALHIAQHQLLVLDLQDEVLPPHPALGLQRLQASQAVIGVADVPVQPHGEQVLGGDTSRGVTGCHGAPITSPQRGAPGR